MVFALCFGQPRKKRGGKLSIGRATVTANLELATEKKIISGVDRAQESGKKNCKAAQRNNHMQDASHQNNR